MGSLTNSIRTMVLAMCAAVATLAFVTAANAEDTLRLKDGKVLTGEVIREIDGGHVLFRYEVAGITREKWVTAEDIESLERDLAPKEDSESDGAVTPDEKEDEAVVVRPGVPRIAILSFGEGGETDMVGLYITAKAFRDAIPLLEEEKVTDVVIRVNSGGGMALEVDRLAHVFQEEYKPRFRLVSWIESAISAAAMSTHCIEEIYFMPEGNYGAATAWSGQLEAVQGRNLEQYLAMMERISQWGRHDPEIMRAMQINEALSASIDEHGRVTWYQDLNGDYIVNNGEEVLTFNSEEAMKFGFAAGIAATKEELARLMGYSEVEWVGKDVPGVPYPVSKAEAFIQDYREQIAEDTRRAREYFTTYGQSIEMARGMQERRDRARFVNRARQALKRLDNMFRHNFNLALMRLGVTSQEQYDEWLREQQELLRDLMK